MAKSRAYSLGSLLFLFVFVLNGAHAQTDDLAGLPDGPEKNLIAERCGLCHTLRNARSRDYNPEGWRELLHQMRNIGTALSDDELDLLAEYLGEHAPQGPRPEAVIVPGEIEIEIREWEVPTKGSMPRDVAVAPNGRIWFSGMFASTLIELDPVSGTLTEHRTRPYSAPMGVKVDANGDVWFASSRRSYVGRFAPSSGEFAYHDLNGRVPDPSGLALDENGRVWWTAQTGNAVGFFEPDRFGGAAIFHMNEGSTPFAIAAATNGDVYIGLRDTKSILRMNMENADRNRNYPLTGPETEPRRIALGDDGMVWYTDIDRGYLSRLDPETGAVTEYPSPSGPLSEPHGIATAGDIVWYVEAGAIPNALVRFDSSTERFQSWPLSGYGVVRDLAVTADGAIAFAMGSLNRVGLIEIVD